MELFDSHLHLDDAAFDADRDAVIQRARAAGVVRMVTVGTGVESCARALALAGRHDGVFASVAIHPHEASQVSERTLEVLRGMTDDRRVVAVGETGLDLVRTTSAPDVQVAAFRAHIHLARERDLPVVIHCREAYPRVLDILEEEGAQRVMMHAFSGSVEIARRCAGRGYFISLAGPVTFKNARTTADVAREIPLDLLLLETDAPVLAPEPRRGRRNEPAYLSYIAERIATLRGVSPETIASAATENARRAFRVD